MDTTMLTRLFALVLVIHCTGWVGSSAATRVSLVDNGYVDLVFAIGEAVPQNQSDIIIENIMKMVEDASPVLYVATGDRAYFKSVRILIPNSWKDVEANVSSWETFEKADVIVDTANPKYQDNPYTQQTRGCGEPGDKIHLTPEYVAHLDHNHQLYGKPGKVFVHEWAHYRYGVFNEYGTPDDDKYPLFYLKTSDNKLLPNLCTDLPPIFTLYDESKNSPNCRTDPATGLYDKNCRYRLDKLYKPVSSLMANHSLDSVVHFCDENMHVKEAKTAHNAMCGTDSVWKVIMRSPDFATDKNQPVDLDTMPTEFSIIRSKGPKRFVLVADVSDSMRISNRNVKLAEATRSWIKDDLPSGSKLGIVWFSSMAHVISELQVITDSKSRLEMMKKVPSQLFSATCIGCGLDLAVKMLTENEDEEKGGTIVLVTDGKSSPGYLTIADVEQDIIEAGIRIISVAFGNKANEDIEYLADLTDGKSYFIHDEDTSEALEQAFFGASTQQWNVQNSELKFKLLELRLEANKALGIEGSFNVDPSVGQNLKLTVFNLEKQTNLDSMELMDPEGNVVTNVEQHGTTTASVTVPLAKIGRWNLKVKLSRAQSSLLLVTVTTQGRPDVKIPITTICKIPQGPDIKDAQNNHIRIHAEVRKGMSAVLGAKVKAFLVKPDGESEILDLMDNGTNADTFADDGVYSRYFTGATMKGRYTVKCQVVSNDDTLISQGFFGSASLQLHDNVFNGTDEGIPLTSFTRIASGGSFQVGIPVSSYDAYPPGDVRDLSVTLVNDTVTNVTVELKWTAPGDELDTGTVSRYELKYSEIVDDVINSNFDDESSVRKRRSVVKEDDLVAGSLKPIEAGSLQTATFRLTDVQPERPYYIALRAVDKADNAGQVSNLGVFFVSQKSALLIGDDFNMKLEGSSGFEARDIINVNQSGYHVTSLLVAAFGLILIACLCVALLMAIIKHVRAYSVYVSVPTSKNHDLP
ncbi:Uncharacterized protein APZ42_033003 [Daphnia magna]|uniref:Uncharacterized protein n=2 Tax=Daphnia magna TaxID=35525 RepID=A0A164LHQ9_9CRUS|nr:hypothetical protein OUZ56_023100 [Daphnia magna]KZS04121.1 Uncharacterized protein APZ42_033003 [Daphnia magna]